MSFTSEVKSEVSKNELHPCCQRAQLAALVQFCSNLIISEQKFRLDIVTQNPTVAKRIISLLKPRYGVQTQLAVLKQQNFKKRNSYELKVYQEVKTILEDLTLWERGLNEHPNSSLLSKKCCARAYLAGAFLAAGSINSPLSSNYHLEISCQQPRLADFIIKLLGRFAITAKKIQRRSRSVVYLKQSEKISDFLRLIGAMDSLMKFEDFRIQRDYINNLSRLDNCDIANEIKIQRSAAKQTEDIALVLSSYDKTDLDVKLVEIIELRTAYPEASFRELSELYQQRYFQTISKSGIRHRLNKVGEIADKLRLAQPKNNE